MKKLFLIIAALFLLIILAAGLWAYSVFFFTKPLTQQELKHLTPDWTKATNGNWSPWFTDIDGNKVWNPTASFNQWLQSIPESQKAWPILIEQHHANKELFQRELLDAKPQTEQWDQFSQILQRPESQAVIDQITQALSRPHMGLSLYTSTDQYEHDALIAQGIEDERWDPNPEPNPSLLNIHHRGMTKHRNAGLLLSASAKRELINNNPDRFVSHVETIIRSRNLQSEFPNAISWLVGLSIEDLGYQTTLWALQTHPDRLSDQHLERLQRAVGDLSRRSMDWQGEAMLFHDICRRVASRTGSIIPINFWNLSNLSATPVSLPDSALHQSVQRMLWLNNISIQQSQPLSMLSPPKNAQSSNEVFELHKYTLSKSTLMLTDMFKPALDKAAQRSRMHIQSALALQLTLAVHRHKRRHSEFPLSIDDIETGLLNINPIDIVNGQTLGYQLADTGPIIYSVGDDRIDDKGQPRWYIKEISELGRESFFVRKYQSANLISQDEAQRVLNESPETISGDWVFFPVPQDDPEPEYKD